VIELWLSEVVHDDDIIQLVSDDMDEGTRVEMVQVVVLELLEVEVPKLDTVVEVMFEQINLMVEMVFVRIDLDDEVDGGDEMELYEIHQLMMINEHEVEVVM
jgi:hypothetical protein